MRILASWAGPRSRRAAEALKALLPRVIQRVSVEVPDEDISTTARTASALKTAGSDDLVIICVASDNVLNPWLAFESGTFAARGVEVMLLLVDISSVDLAGPLTGFQSFTASYDGLFGLIHQVNQRTEAPLTDGVLSSLFSAHWSEIGFSENGALSIRSESVGDAFGLRWNQEVRRRLGERRVFIRATLPSLDRDKVRNQLARCLKQERMPGLAATLTFGPYDLLLEGWVHIAAVQPLEQSLATSLALERRPELFLVDHSYEPQPSPHITTDWAPELVRAVQAGAQDAYDRALQIGLVVRADERPAGTIRGYVAIRLLHEKPGLTREIAAEMLRRPAWRDYVVCGGSGFCNILVKAEVRSANYFELADLSQWLRELLRHFAPTLETYVQADPSPLHAGHERIDERTFLELRGQDPLINSVLPEVYDQLTPAADEIIQLLASEDLESLNLPSRKLLGDYLRGYLEGQFFTSDLTLHGFFSQLELYFQQTLPIILRARGLDIRDVPLENS